MKTSKEFFETLQSDEAFAAEVSKKAKEKIDAGQNDYKEIWIPFAAEYGYELTSASVIASLSVLTKALSVKGNGQTEPYYG